MGTAIRWLPSTSPCGRCQPLAGGNTCWIVPLNCSWIVPRVQSEDTGREGAPFHKRRLSRIQRFGGKEVEPEPAQA